MVEGRMEVYPEPRIPQHTVLSSGTFSGERPGEHVASILDAGAVKFVTSGRVGIALALKHIGAGRGDTILVPAYHCSSMVEPVLWAGARPVFYRVHEDASVDVADVRAKIDPATKALLVTHYFGFHQDMPTLRALCDEAGIALIEDCAHAFFGNVAGGPPGWYGDYAIASSMKFFPVIDGGCLVSSRRSLGGIRIVRAGLGFQLKAAINTVEEALHYGRLVRLGMLLKLPFRIKDALWRALKSLAPEGTARNMAPAASSGGHEFDAAWIDKRMSVTSQLIMGWASKSRIIRRRRKNYRRMLDALSDLPGGRPLFRELPDDVVPYVFPMVVDDPQRAFPALKRLGVPILRWEQLFEGVDDSVCPVSVRFSRCLLQFPCHEELKPEELEWMIAQIRSVLGP
jgi:dTDP-4-amino-4,6-dideoxygalactose transaminase